MILMTLEPKDCFIKLDCGGPFDDINRSDYNLTTTLAKKLC